MFSQTLSLIQFFALSLSRYLSFNLPLKILSHLISPTVSFSHSVCSSHLLSIYLSNFCWSSLPYSFFLRSLSFSVLLAANLSVKCLRVPNLSQGTRSLCQNSRSSSLSDSLFLSLCSSFSPVIGLALLFTRTLSRLVFRTLWSVF